MGVLKTGKKTYILPLKQKSGNGRTNTEEIYGTQ